MLDCWMGGNHALNWCFSRNLSLCLNAEIQGLILRPELDVQINVYVHLNCQGAVLQCAAYVCILPGLRTNYEHQQKENCIQ